MTNMKLQKRCILVQFLLRPLAGNCGPQPEPVEPKCKDNHGNCQQQGHRSAHLHVEISFSATEWPPSYGAPQMISSAQYSWCSEEGKRSKGCELRLDLLSERGEVRGCFAINRRYPKSSLRSDVDCLTAEFASALSSALQRAVEGNVTSARMAGVAENTSTDIESAA